MKKDKKIKIGVIYKHQEGLLYRVDEIDIHDVTDYENGVKPKEMILYTQLEKGKYPIGKKWIRKKESFSKYFVESKKGKNK
jgi:hypothetical protein